MGRRVETVIDQVWYMPDIDDNRDDPEPFKVLIQPMTAADMKQSNSTIMGAAPKHGKKINFLRRSERIVKKIISENVIEVEGYEIGTGASFSKPKNGAELYAAIQEGPAKESDILDDIFAALRDVSILEEGLLKNSNSLSDTSTPGGIVQSPGVADGVDGTIPAKSLKQTEGGSETATATQTGTLAGNGRLLYAAAPGPS